MVTDAELEALGLHEPGAPYAAERLELIRYLIGLGATTDDLVASREMLPGLAMVLGLRLGDALSVGQVAQRSGLPEGRVLRIVRATGLPEPAPGDPALTEGFVGLCGLVQAAGELFGEEATLQLMRVMGSMMSRLADALISAFIANVAASAREGDPVGLKMARANAEAIELFPAIGPLLDALLRQHLVAAQRVSVAENEAGVETRRLCVGFVDLVGSTRLSRELSMIELGRVLGRFEEVTMDRVAADGGRLVKFIGDEILYTARDAVTGTVIALDLVEALAGEPGMPPVRAGVAVGEVMLRDGDVFGPVVNLAARAAKVGRPGTILVPLEVAGAITTPSVSIGTVDLRGIGPVELFSVRRRAADGDQPGPLGNWR